MCFIRLWTHTRSRLCNVIQKVSFFTLCTTAPGSPSSGSGDLKTMRQWAPRWLSTETVSCGSHPGSPAPMKYSGPRFEVRLRSVPTEVREEDPSLPTVALERIPHLAILKTDLDLCFERGHRPSVKVWLDAASDRACVRLRQMLMDLCDVLFDNAIQQCFQGAKDIPSVLDGFRPHSSVTVHVVGTAD